MKMESFDCVILGAGISGLAAAAEARARNQNYVLLEKNIEPGGLTRSIYVGDSAIDYTGHLLHLRKFASPSKVPHFNLVDEDWQQLPKVAKCLYDGKLIDAPFQYNVGQLGAEAQQECTRSYLEAQERAVRQSDAGKAPGFSEYMNLSFGTYIAERFLVPYNEKLFGRPVSELAPDSGKRFFPPPQADLIQGKKAPFQAYNSSFWYPKKDGIGLLVKGVLQNELNTRTAVRITSIDVQERVIQTDEGSLRYGRLISSIPLDRFCELSTHPELKSQGQTLTSTDTLTFNLVVQGKPPRELEDVQWVYVSEPKYPFYRVGFYSQFNTSMCPADSYSLYIEVGERSDASRPADQTRLLNSCLSSLKELGWVDPEQVRSMVTHRISPGYVNFDPAHQYTTARIFDLGREFGIRFIGRYGRWDYISMEDGIADGLESVQSV